MRSTIAAVVLTATWGGAPAAHACMCVPWPPGATHAAPFLTVARDSELVVVAEVVRHVGKRHTKRKIHEAMRVTVLEVLRGTEECTTLTIRGDNGVLCRPYVSRFPPGTKWVLALSPAHEKRGDYSISSCGEYWLPLADDAVRGHIHPDPLQRSPDVEMPLGDLRSLIKGQ
jgi:hypothetical protein